MEININPVALDLGVFKIHWYGIMYLVAFITVYLFGMYRARQTNKWQTTEVSDLVFYGAIGAILGGRIGYAMFYDFANFIESPLGIFKIWQGGMSFHGGLIGAMLGMYIYSRITGRKFFAVADFVAPLVSIGLGAGRLGNFINGELWGKPTDLPWGMIFPNTDDLGLTRHPSMLYELFLEGIVLFIIIWIFSSKPRPLYAVSGLWLLLYGFFRFVVEFVRMPDAHIGYLVWDWLTMGQLLSAPMMLFGIILIIYAYRKNAAVS